MSETIVRIILVLLAIGQVVALFRGRDVAIIYWICVAPLTYFSTWFQFTWDPGRLCGVILLVGLFTLYPSIKFRMPLPLTILYWYGVLITVAFIPFTPSLEGLGRSAFYGVLRPAVQIFTWTLIYLVAREIAAMLATRARFLPKMRHALIIFSVFLVLYGVYQTVAFNRGMHATGIRRSYQGVTGEAEQVGSFYESGDRVFRANAFFQEPKHFGQFILISLALLVSFLFSKGQRLLHGFVSSGLILLLLLTGLWLSFSSSAWGGVVMLAIFTLAGLMSLRGRSSPLIAVFAVILMVGAFAFTATDTGRIQNIWEARTTSRVAKGLFSDIPEQYTLKAFRDYPYLVLTGSGRGNISSYLRKYSGRDEVVLAPNSGVLSFVADLGVIGLLLLLYMAVVNAWQYLVASRDPNRTVMSYIGLVCIAQLMIYPSTWLTTIGFAFLAAGSLSPPAEDAAPVSLPAAQPERVRINFR